MIVSIGDQASLFLLTVCIGFLIGFVYDLLRIFRKTIPHANLFIHLEDLLYWIFVALAMFYIMLHRNYGEVRAFSVFGAFLGMILYFLTLSPIFMKITLTILQWLQQLILFLWKLILYPIRIFIKILSVPWSWIKLVLRSMKGFMDKWTGKGKRFAKKKGRQWIKELEIIIKKV